MVELEAGHLRRFALPKLIAGFVVASCRFYPRHDLRVSDAPCAVRPSAPLVLRQPDWGATVAVVPARSAKRLYSCQC